MATRKTKSTTQKLKEAKETIKGLELEIEQVKSISVPEQEVEQKYVDKEQLRQESLLERLSWWFKDLNPMQRLIAHASVFTFILAGVTGVYFATSELTGAEQIGEYFSLMLAVIGLLTGVNFQLKGLKLPAKYNTSHLKDS